MILPFFYWVTETCSIFFLKILNGSILYSCMPS